MVLARAIDRRLDGEHTNRTTNSNHLQMAPLQATLQRGVGSVMGGTLEIEARAISSRMAGDAVVGVSLETVDDSLA